MKDSLSVVLMALLAVGWALPTAPGPDCDAYPYCEGTSFNATMILSVRKITCDRARQPRDHCCLPQAKHFVCYGITVDGQYLNYDNDPLRTTDFTGLCAAMIKQHAPAKKPGKHSSATIDGGHDGTLVWRYGDWTETDKGSQYIKNIACETASTSLHKPQDHVPADAINHTSFMNFIASNQNYLKKKLSFKQSI